jgi:hypothetical protein
MTSLENIRHAPCDPRWYLGASQAPYLVLPPEEGALEHARLGDLAGVHDRLNGQAAFAIFGIWGELPCSSEAARRAVCAPLGSAEL